MKRCNTPLLQETSIYQIFKIVNTAVNSLHHKTATLELLGLYVGAFNKMFMH